MLSQFLLPMLREEFGAAAFSEGDDPLVTFAAAHPAVGELRLFEVGKEGRIEIGDLTHGHFYCFGNYETREEEMQELAENMFEFVCELFSSHYVLWSAKNGGIGGWFYLHPNEAPSLPVAADKANWFFWSGPIGDIGSI